MESARNKDGISYLEVLSGGVIAVTRKCSCRVDIYAVIVTHTRGGSCWLFILSLFNPLDGCVRTGVYVVVVNGLEMCFGCVVTRLETPEKVRCCVITPTLVLFV